MKIYPSIRKLIANQIVAKWTEITKMVPEKTPNSIYLSGKYNGEPAGIEMKNEWSIRDCLLNNQKVQAYIDSSPHFRGKNLKEKLEKYNGYKFYQHVYLRTADDCPLPYLDTYSILLGKTGFKDFVESNKDKFRLEEFALQVERIREEIADDNSVKQFEIRKKQNRNYDLPPHLFGYYHGYFLRPRKSEEKNQFSKLTVLLCDNNIALVRTTRSEKDLEEAKYYEGVSFMTNQNTFHVEFVATEESGNSYEFSFVFDIQTRRQKDIFKESNIIRGIYAGSDITTRRPVAGRLILHQEENWLNLLTQKKNRDVILEEFKTNKQYSPHDLTGTALQRVFQVKETKRNFIREFFTIEERYLEDTDSIRKYVRSPIKYDTVAGCYSIYSLDSTGLEIKRGVMRISAFGEVHIKGTRVSGSNVRKFHGWATVLKNDNLSIVVYTEIEGKEFDDQEIISYLVKLNIKSSKDVVKVLYGIRLMNSANRDGSSVPFSGRVALVKERRDFYENTESLVTIRLFDPNLSKAESNKLKNFKELENGSIYNLLVGLENNIIKGFGTRREKMGFSRRMNYKENFYRLATFHVTKENPNYELVVINLYYSLLHGKENVLEVIFQDKAFDSFVKDPYFKIAFELNKETNKWTFEPLEIEKIKGSLQRGN